MKKLFALTPAIRVSIGLVMFNISVILIADLLGMVPNTDDVILDSRKKVCESLAVQLSLAASDSNYVLINSTLENFALRNDDVIAVSMSQVNGVVVAEYGEFKLFDPLSHEVRSSINMVVVPVFSGETRWGSVNVEFNSMGVGFLSSFSNSDYLVLLFIALSSFLGYMFILKRSLQVLDPRAVIPGRVNAAFNTLAEGVVIVDDKERIVMANESFASIIGQQAEDLVGMDVSGFKWKLINNGMNEDKAFNNKHRDDDRLPWKRSIKEGDKQVGVLMSLATQNGDVRAISANSSPIHDGKGSARGALITIDDITDVEEANLMLESTVDKLQKNDAEIRQKNQELEILASRDSLTGCYNRRAFFDLMENAFQKAVANDENFSCIMFDIDHFKNINDTYGHAVGDEAIRMVADILNSCKREGAIVGRYGGEEFCIALPKTSIDEAFAVAEEFRISVRETSHNFCAEGSRFTASSGVSVMDDNSSNCSQLLEHADQALYVAKESGRDRVIKWKNRSREDVDHELQAHMPELVTTPAVTQSQVDTVPVLNDVIKLDAAYAENLTQSCDLASDNVNALQCRISELEHQLIDKSNRTSPLDAITQLPSRYIFEDRVTQAIEYSSRTEKLIAVAILNVDMFSRINDALGRVVGDEFLRAAAQRLKTIVRRSDTVAAIMSPGQSGPSIARINNDEFAILLTGLNSLDSLTHVVKRIQEKYSGKIEVAGNELFVTTTTGIAVYPHDGDAADDLLEHARIAQRQATGLTGRNNYQFYSPDINRRVVDQMQLEIDMLSAIEKGSFALYYQPKLDLTTNKINSFEALIRWPHETRGMVFPNDFIPVAEKTRMIIGIGDWAIRQACRQMRQWIDQGLPDDIRVSVNVSAIEFAEDNFNEKVFNIIKEEGVSAKNLEIELTETTVVNDTEKSAAVIDELRYRGVTVALDDFGTGFSSFEYLGALDFNWLKIDRAFINDALSNERTRSLYAGIVSMCRAIDVRVVAEGIETQEQYDFVRGLGVDELQGYLLSKPLPQSEIVAHLKEANSRAEKPARNKLKSTKVA